MQYRDTLSEVERLIYHYLDSRLSEREMVAELELLRDVAGNDGKARRWLLSQIDALLEELRKGAPRR